VRLRDYPSAFEQYIAVDSLAPKQERIRTVEGNELFRFAETALSDGEYYFAAQAYEKIIEKHPRGPYLLKSEFSLASTFKEQGLYNEAIVRFEDLASRRKNSREGYMALFELSDIWFNQFHDVEKCEEVLQRLLVEYPSIPQRYQAMLDLGDCKVVQNQLGHAAQWYQSATTMKTNNINPITEQGLFKLGELAFLNGEIDTALSKLNSVINMNVPRNSPQSGQHINDALNLIIIINNNCSDEEILKTFAKAMLLRRQWKDEEAKQLLLDLIKTEPTSEIGDEALLIIGEIAFDSNNPDEALRAFSEIQTRFPDSYFSDLALKRSAEVYEFLLSNFDEAQKIYEKLLVTYPQSIYIEEIRKKIRELEGVS
jgi:TolA-binding protein